MEEDFRFKGFIKRVAPVTVLIIILFIACVATVLYAVLMNQTRVNLEALSRRVQEDLIIKDGKWDLSLYNADNHIIDANPLYIITSEGYIVERSRPIHGLLDLSRFTLIGQYLSPTTVDTVTHESWRVLSASTSAEQPAGAILATVYEPKAEDLPVIDKQLQDIISKIQAQININGDIIDVSQVDPRHLPYDVSFQIVTRFNKVLFQSNNVNSITRMPTFIDRSYIDNQLKSPAYKEVVDSVTKVRYLMLTTPLLDENNLIAGIIVMGMSIDPIYSVLKMFSISALLISGTLLLLALPFAYRFATKTRKSIQEAVKQKSLPKVITFMKKDCKLIIDDQVIDIPYSSHQYYFCQALFQKPQKKWEVDELLEVLGEDFGPEKWRKVYDTMVALNKKTGHIIDKLFVVRDKRYFINAQLIPVVKADT